MTFSGFEWEKSSIEGNSEYHHRYKDVSNGSASQFPPKYLKKLPSSLRYVLRIFWARKSGITSRYASKSNVIQVNVTQESYNVEEVYTSLTPDE